MTRYSVALVGKIQSQADVLSEDDDMDSVECKDGCSIDPFKSNVY